MKNPFLDTTKYTIVRQFNRLASKKRSISQTCPRSFKSPYSFHIYPKDHHFTDSLHFSSGNYEKYNINKGNEYQIQPGFKKSCIEQKRPSLLNFEQLRYRPYSLANSSNFFSSSLQDRLYNYGLGSSIGEQFQGKINSQKYEVKNFSSSIKEGQTSYQKDYKQKDEILNVLPQDIENYSQKMAQQNHGTSAKPNIKDKRQSSIGGTMLKIKENTKSTLKNYEYTSMNDADMGQNYICNQNVKKKKRYSKKPSIYEELKSIQKLTLSQKQNSPEYRIKNKENQKKISRSCLSQLEVSQKSVKEQNDHVRQFNKCQHQKSKQKPLIQIRGQVFYLQEKVKKKY